MLADPLSIPIDAVVEETTPTGEPIVLSRYPGPDGSSEWKIPASESPLTGSVAETLMINGLRTVLSSTESGKGLGKIKRTLVRHNATAVESDGTTTSTLSVYTVVVSPVELSRRPVASAVLAGLLQYARSFNTMDNTTAILDGQR